MQIELNEEDLVQLILLVTADIVAESRRQPPDTDFKPALSDLAMKLQKAREKEIMAKNIGA
jgi:hypothetical protein